MQYTASVHFTGDPAKAFDLAVSALMALGFRTHASDPAKIDMVGPGLNSTRQSALLGASRIIVNHSDKELVLAAELGGVARLARLITIFPIVLTLGLAGILALVFSFLFPVETWIFTVLLVAGGNLLLWLILAPIMKRSVLARTCRGLDSLLYNMAIAGSEPAAV